MKPEQITVGFATAKRLDELGFKRDSIYKYIEMRTIRSDANELNVEHLEWVLDDKITITDKQEKRKIVNVFIAEELLDALPVSKQVGSDIYFIYVFSRKGKDVGLSTTVGHRKKDNLFFKESSLAEALAKLLIHLIENKLVTIGQLNKI